MKTPAGAYKESEIKFIGGRLELRYGKGFKTRYVKGRGYINWDNKRVFIGNPFNGYHAGLKKHIGAPMEVWFANSMLGKTNSAAWLAEPEFNNGKVVFKGTHK
ncbi:MAG: hypothetical protein LBH43_12260 [Treponema sp.]|jgi:hypothetical protein|nr:hypothetical protein [Treponema sp.]